MCHLCVAADVSMVYTCCRGCYITCTIGGHKSLDSDSCGAGPAGEGGGVSYSPLCAGLAASFESFFCCSSCLLPLLRHSKSSSTVKSETDTPSTSGGGVRSQKSLYCARLLLYI